MGEIKEKNEIINILYVIAAMGPGFGGGAERALINLAKRVNREKYKPIVCCVTRGGPSVEELKEANIPIYILGKKSKIDISVLFKLIKIIRKEKISIIHTYMFTSNMWGRLAAILSRVPVIITSEQALSYHEKEEWYHIFIDKFLSFFTDKITAVSPEVAESVVKKEGISPKKIKVIFNGVELNKFDRKIDVYSKKRELGLDPSFLTIGIVGSLTPVKRIDLFLRIASLVLKVKPQVQFVIVGEGVLLDNLEKLAIQLKIKEKVFFLGGKNREEIPQIFKIMDIYVLTSKSEGLPTVLIEAGASGVPVVSFDVGGVRNIVIDGKTGFLIPSGNLELMTEAIIKLLDNSSKREEMGREAKEYVKKFDVSEMVKNTESLYEELIDKKLLKKK